MACLAFAKCLSLGLSFSCTLIQNNVPGLLEIYRTYGVLKRQGWRQHIFQIKNGYLKYYSGTNVSTKINVELLS